MLLRDRLRLRLAEMGDSPDYVRLSEEVLGIRNASVAIARRLVAQALVMEDRRDEWARVGERVCAQAPDTPGVYVLRDAVGAALYVGKAINLRRRLRTHFARRRWPTIKPALARVADVEWREVGSELEALLREAEWIRAFAPLANVQVGPPSVGLSVPARLLGDVVVIVPSIEADSVELVATCASGSATILRTRRNGADLNVHAGRLWRLFRRRRDVRADQSPNNVCAPIVFSWLARRGANATRIEIAGLLSSRDLRDRLSAALGSTELFAERLVLRNSRPTSKRTT